MSKKVQYVHSYPNQPSDPAAEAGRTVFYAKSDGVYVRLANSDVVGPLGAGGGGVGKYATTIGDGSTTTFTLTHGLGSTDVLTQVFRTSNGEQVWTTVMPLSSTQIALSFAIAPTSNEFRVVVQG